MGLTYPPQTILGYRKDGRPIRVIAGGKSNPSAAPGASPSPSTGGYDPTAAAASALAGGAFSTTSGPDIWYTGTYGDLPVVVSKVPTGGPASYGASGDILNVSSGRYAPPGFADNTDTVNNVLQRAQQFSGDEMKDLQSRLFLAGMYAGTGVKSAKDIPFGQYDENTIQAYGNLLKLNATQIARGNSQTVDDTLNQLIQQQTATGNNNPGGAKSTRTTYSISDPESAKSILSNVLQAYTGRNIPTPEETQAFQSALNSYEQSHPSRTTDTFDATGSLGTETSTDGINYLSSGARQQFAQDWLMQNEGGQVANYQAATTYYQAALQALGAPVSVK